MVLLTLGGPPFAVATLNSALPDSCEDLLMTQSQADSQVKCCTSHASELKRSGLYSTLPLLSPLCLAACKLTSLYGHRWLGKSSGPENPHAVLSLLRGSHCLLGGLGGFETNLPRLKVSGAQQALFKRLGARVYRNTHHFPRTLFASVGCAPHRVPLLLWTLPPEGQTRQKLLGCGLCCPPTWVRPHLLQAVQN